MRSTKFITTITLTVIAMCAHPQSRIEWKKTFGGNSMEMAKCICPLPDGGFLLGGSSSSLCSGTKMENLKGVMDFWILRIDGNGKVLWDRKYGGSTIDELSAVLITSDGGYLLAGHSTSYTSGDKTDNSRGEFDYWIVKINNQGDKIWDRTYGGNKHDYLLTVQQTKDNGFILGGSSCSDASADKSEPSRGRNDYWIIKTDSTGFKKWDKTLGGSGEDRLTRIIQINDGGYILGGISSSGISVYKSEVSRGNYDYWLVKLDGKGRMKWDKTIGGHSNDYLQCINETKTGEILVGGYSCSGVSGDKQSAAFGSYDYWVVSLSKEGRVKWERTYGEDTDDKLVAVHQTADGGFILNGNSSIANWKKNDFASVNRIIKIDAKGNELWEEVIGLDKSGFFNYSGIVCSQDSGYIVFGHTATTLAENPDLTDDTGTTDFCLMKFYQEHPWNNGAFHTNKNNTADQLH